MGLTIVSIYLKLNIILLLALLAWAGTRKLTQILQFSLSSQGELRLIRVYFLLSLAFPILTSIFINSPFIKTEIPGMTIIGKNISTGIDTGLNSNISLAGQNLNLLLLITVLLVIGSLLLFVGKYRDYKQLKTILKNSIQWKALNGVSILFSQQVTTPFSTKILGTNQVILPYQLLESPRNFRLAVKHELQHIRNGDLTWVLLLDFFKPLFFWNPAFYAWHNQFHCLQEYACDEALIKKPDVNLRAYGECLLEVASHSNDKGLFASSNMIPNFSMFGDTQSQLKRRILMLTNNRSKKFETIKFTTYSIFLISLLAGCSMSVMNTSESEMLPISTVLPTYPLEALKENIEGWVVVGFTVNQQGNVINPSVIGSCSDQNTPPTRDDINKKNVKGCPDDILFDASALRAIEQFKFEPRMHNGNYVSVPEVVYKFSYTLQN